MRKLIISSFIGIVLIALLTGCSNATLSKVEGNSAITAVDNFNKNIINSDSISLTSDGHGGCNILVDGMNIGSIYVADGWNNTVIVMTPDGVNVAGFNVNSTGKGHKFYSGIVLDTNNNTILTFGDNAFIGGDSSGMRSIILPTGETIGTVSKIEDFWGSLPSTGTQMSITENGKEVYSISDSSRDGWTDNPTAMTLKRESRADKITPVIALMLAYISVDWNY